MYIPSAVLADSNSRVLTAENGFVVQRQVAAVVWAYKYALHRKEVGRFPEGDKAALVARIEEAAVNTIVRVAYKESIGSHYWGMVTVMCDNRVSLVV